MKITHHPDDSTIMAYAAGTLGEGFSLVTAAHMEYCSDCRRRLQDAEALGGELIMDLPPVKMTDSGMDAVWELIQREPQADSHTVPKSSASSNLPSVLSPYIEGDSLENIRWRNLVPGIRHYVLDNIDSGNGSVRLLAISPGVTIPHHTHNGGEMALILEGSYADEIGHYKFGDLADLDETITHQPKVNSTKPCICLIATDDKLHFTSVFSRMLQPLIRM